MTHKLTAAKVDKPATLPLRSAAASRVEKATDIAAAESDLACPPFLRGGRFDCSSRGLLTQNFGGKDRSVFYPGGGSQNDEAALFVERALNGYDALRTSNAELVEAAKAVVQAWVHDEIGQIDGSHIEALTAAINKHGGAA